MISEGQAGLVMPDHHRSAFLRIDGGNRASRGIAKKASVVASVLLDALLVLLRQKKGCSFEGARHTGLRATTSRCDLTLFDCVLFYPNRQ